MEFRLTPLTDSAQHLLQHRQRVTPSRPVRQYVDALGNTVSYFNLVGIQERIEVSFDSIVETHPVHFRGLTIEDDHARVTQDVRDFHFLSTFVVVVAEHRDDGNLDGGRQLPRQNPRLFLEAVVGEIPADHQHIRSAVDLVEQRLKRALRGF